MPQTDFHARFPEKTVMANGLGWQTIDSGGAGPDSPCLLLLPGTLGTAEIWRNQIIALAREMRCVAVTYPVTDDIARLADGLAALCDQLHIARFSVVGSSLGGFVAQYLAARHPQRIEMLFIGNSLADPALANVTGMDIATLEALPAEQHRAFILASVESWPETSPAITALKAVLRDSGTRLLSAEALKARILAIRKATAVPKLALPDSRVIVIDCADDPLLPRAVQDDVVRRYPEAAHHRLPTGGHYPYLVEPAIYTGLLRQGIARRPR